MHRNGAIVLGIALVLVAPAALAGPGDGEREVTRDYVVADGFAGGSGPTGCQTDQAPAPAVNTICVEIEEGEETVSIDADDMTGQPPSGYVAFRSTFLGPIYGPAMGGLTYTCLPGTFSIPNGADVVQFGIRPAWAGDGVLFADGDCSDNAGTTGTMTFTFT